MGVGQLRIKGTVKKDGEPVEGAYITLISGDTLIAERRTGPDGFYEFHITPGEWKLTARAASAAAMTKEIKKAEPAELTEDFDLQPVG